MYSEVLYDDIGNAHPRMNKYLDELSKLQTQYEDSPSDRLKADIAKLKKEKDNHPYIKSLKAYEEKKKAFDHDLRKKVAEFRSKLPNEMSRRMKGLKVDEFIASAEKDFYSSYKTLSYETLYEYEKACIEVAQYPSIIEHLDANEQGLIMARGASKVYEPEKEKLIKADVDRFTLEEKAVRDKSIQRLKEKRAQGIISKKALEDGITEAKLLYRDNVKVKSYEVPSKANRELIGNKKFEINKTNKRKVNVLKANVADLRRKTPVEIERQTPVNAWIGILIPGVGQALNKQYIKALMFLLMTVFIYAIAIPYSLGFANYQGDGIAGLISLAEGGRKIDKSIIFMIEGIISLFLCAFSVVFYYVSFKDALDVEKNAIKGTRPNNWFETRVRASEEGFPIMVSMPALFVTVFIVIVPITTAILLSFTGMDPKNQSKFPWVGLENYKLIALGEGIAGSNFWLILGWTVIWTLTATTLAILLGFFLALAVNNERIKGKVFFRSVFLLPWAVPAFITVMFFNIMFSPSGAMTELISNVVGYNLVVKQDANLTRITLIMIQGWLGSSYVFLLSTGVLQAIPADLYEAAQIDGATPWQRLRRITLPIVLFQTAPLLVGQYTFNFNNFSVIYLFNTGGPFEPTKYGNLAGASDLLISYIYKLVMDNQYQAIGAAITIVISMGLMVFAFIGFRNSKAFREEKL